MQSNIYTIGFTKKTAEEFFNLISINSIDILIDIRLNNTSQLASFTKYPDIQFFLKKICNVKYIHDTMFAPLDSTLHKYKEKLISWEQYEVEFIKTMTSRNITNYILSNYTIENTLCLLCSEPTAERCHRSIISNCFKSAFSDLNIIHI